MKHERSFDAIRFEQRGIHARDAGNYAEAEDHFTQAVTHDPGRPLSWLGLALSQIDLKRPEAALVNLRRAQELSPQSGVVAHLLDSLSGHTSSRAPDAYVSWLFNTYAEGFDLHLARLGSAIRARPCCIAWRSAPAGPRMAATAFSISAAAPA